MFESLIPAALRWRSMFSLGDSGGNLPERSPFFSSLTIAVHQQRSSSTPDCPSPWPPRCTDAPCLVFSDSARESARPPTPQPRRRAQEQSRTLPFSSASFVRWLSQPEVVSCVRVYRKYQFWWFFVQRWVALPPVIRPPQSSLLELMRRRPR